MLNKQYLLHFALLVYESSICISRFFKLKCVTVESREKKNFKMKSAIYTPKYLVFLLRDVPKIREAVPPTPAAKKRVKSHATVFLLILWKVFFYRVFCNKELQLSPFYCLLSETCFPLVKFFRETDTDLVLLVLYTLQRKSYLCIPFWELHRLGPNFHIPVSVSDLYIPRTSPHISCNRICRLIYRGNIYFA